MKKHILALIFISAAALAQTNPHDGDKGVSKLNTTKSEKEESFSKKEDSIKILKDIIKETNRVFLREIFDEKYIKNENYFKVTDLLSANDDNTQKFKNSDVIIKSIMVDEHDPSVKEKCKYALEFNKTYLKLFDIRKNVLFVKYDSIKVNQAIKDIKNLSELDVNSKLDVTKNKIRNYLENYLERTCELKIILEKLKSNPDQNPTFKQKYTILENKEDYKDYPYLIQIIRKIKNNRNDYSKDDLQPCEDIKKSTTEAVKPEVIKENTPKKEEKIEEEKPKAGTK